jgi:hypothetical protein
VLQHAVIKSWSLCLDMHAQGFPSIFQVLSSRGSLRKLRCSAGEDQGWDPREHVCAKNDVGGVLVPAGLSIAAGNGWVLSLVICLYGAYLVSMIGYLCTAKMWLPTEHASSKQSQAPVAWKTHFWRGFACGRPSTATSRFGMCCTQVGGVSAPEVLARSTG